MRVRRVPRYESAVALFVLLANLKGFALFPYITGFTSLSITTQTVACGGTPTQIVSNWTTASGCGNADLYDVNWYSNTVNSASGGTLIYTQSAVAVATTYTLPSAAISTTPGTLYYYVVITVNSGNGACLVGGSPAATSAVTINGTSVGTQPVNQNVCAGGTATFGLSATGTGGALTYQWQDNSGGSFADISGETSTTLNLTTVTTALNGRQYQCRVTGGCGPVVRSKKKRAGPRPCSRDVHG